MRHYWAHALLCDVLLHSGSLVADKMRQEAAPVKSCFMFVTALSIVRSRSLSRRSAFASFSFPSTSSSFCARNSRCALHVAPKLSSAWRQRCMMIQTYGQRAHWCVLCLIDTQPAQFLFG